MSLHTVIIGVFVFVIMCTVVCVCAILLNQPDEERHD